MAVYEYTAVDERGNEFSSTYSNINNVAVLREELAKMGDTLLEARRKKTRIARRKITQNEIVAFAYKFAGMSSAGLSIIRSLETLEEQSRNQAFKDVFSDIRQSIATGSTLKDAFENHKEIFSDFFLGMLEAGESGGKLSETLEMSAVYLEKRADFRRKIRSAFTYPIVVGLSALLVVVFLVIFVVPVFLKLYRQMHVTLPIPTRILVGLSLMIRDWWWAILLFIAGAVLLFKILSRNPRVKAGWDAFKLNIPGFAKLSQMVVVSQFIRTFAMLGSVGVSFIRALDIASIVVCNSKVAEIADQLQQSIRAGNPVADSLRCHEIFPPMIVQLAASGEESGTLLEMLNKGADFLDKDIDRAINGLLVKVEPATTIVMGIIVGFIIMSVYLPMFDYMSHLK